MIKQVFMSDVSGLFSLGAMINFDSSTVSYFRRQDGQDEGFVAFYGKFLYRAYVVTQEKTNFLS